MLHSALHQVHQVLVELTRILNRPNGTPCTCTSGLRLRACLSLLFTTLSLLRRWLPQLSKLNSSLHNTVVPTAYRMPVRAECCNKAQGGRTSFSERQWPWRISISIGKLFNKSRRSYLSSLHLPLSPFLAITELLQFSLRSRISTL